jgi:hypothetical protein
MTLIVGINTSEAIYLASDTRVTLAYKDRPLEYRNNLQKTIPLSRHLAVAAAGNVRLATFLTWKLDTQTRSPERNIRGVRERVEGVLKDAAHEYYERVPYDRHTATPNCSLLIAGTDVTGRKRARVKERFDGLADAATRLKERAEAEMRRVAEAATTQGGMITAARVMAESKSQGLPMRTMLFDALRNAAGADGYSTLPVVDTHLFSVTVRPDEFRIEDTEWGEGLARGATEAVRKDVTPNDLMAAIEFGDPANAPSLLTSQMFHVAKKHDEPSIGGAVFVVIITADGIAYWGGRVRKIVNIDDMTTEDTSEVIVQGQEVFVRDKGELVKLVHFTEWTAAHADAEASA